MFTRPLLLFMFTIMMTDVSAHGGAEIEVDECVMTLGSERVHFSAYQPEIEEGAEYCRDIPSVGGKTIIVLDVIEKTLREIGVGLKIYPQENPEIILISVEPKKVSQGVVEAIVNFPESGRYIAEVTGRDNSKARMLLNVEFTDWGGIIVGILYDLIRLLIVGYLLFRFYKYIRGKMTKQNGESKSF